MKKGAIFFFMLWALMINTSAQKLFLENSFFNEEEITDLVLWRNDVWASTNKGLYQLEHGHYQNIAVPPTENDKITALFNNSPYALVCGTYKGNLIFISQDDQNFCSVNWELHDPRVISTFYISSIGQNHDGLWVGSLEKGAYRVDPVDKSLQNFSLDFDDDTIGLNVYHIAIGPSQKVWANSQDGLYFILDLFRDGNLQYVKSGKFSRPFSHMTEGPDGVYAFFQTKRGKSRLLKLGFRHSTSDATILKRFRLPEELKYEPIRALSISQNGELWILGSVLWRFVKDEWVPYELPETMENIDISKVVVHKDKIWMSAPFNGVFMLSTNDKLKGEKLEGPIANVALGVKTELKNVFFEPGDSALIPISHKALNPIALQMLGDKSLKLEVRGHTAQDGDSLFLQQLSVARARSVKQFLVTKGVAEHRITVSGWGARQLKNTVQPKSGENRRVEILLKAH